MLTAAAFLTVRSFSVLIMPRMMMVSNSQICILHWLLILCKISKSQLWEHHHHYSERMRNKLFVPEFRWNDAFLHKEKCSRATTIFLILLENEEKKKDLVMADCSHRDLGKARMCVSSVSHIFWCVMFLSGKKN